MNEYTTTPEEITIANELKSFSQNKKLQEKINDDISEHVFSKIGEYIKSRLPKDLDGNYGTSHYQGADQGGDEDICILPKDWKVFNPYIAAYSLSCSKDDDKKALTHLEIAMNCDDQCTLCMYFWINLNLFDKATLHSIKQKVSEMHENIIRRNLTALRLNSTDEIKFGTEENYPWIFTIPFKLDSQSVIDEYPELDKSLEPIGKALESVFTSYELIKDAVDELKEIAQTHKKK